jgi:hypothetical protein
MFVSLTPARGSAKNSIDALFGDTQDVEPREI